MSKDQAENGPPVRDLKLDVLTKFAHENWSIPHLTNPALKPVADSMRANIARIRLLMLLPSTISGHVVQAQKCTDIAELEITGAIGKAKITAEIREKIESRFYELWDVLKAEHEQLRGSPEWDAHVGSYHAEAIAVLLPLAKNAHGALSFLHLFSSYLTGIWTAIETMLGDLWEASLNAHPERLASLNGNAKRISKLNSTAPQDTASSRQKSEHKTIPLHLIAMHRYDVKQKMGTMLRSEFEFSKLSAIREAYSCAFDTKSGRIDTALASKSLDALSAIRNAIVHKAGFADEEYYKRTKFLPLPKAEIGHAIHLDGETVIALIGPSIKAASDTMNAVSDWLEQNRESATI